jgi:hypothetical protein
MINDGIRPTPAWTAAGRHAAAVTTETATNAVTRNHSPNSTPVAPAAAKAHNMGFEPLISAFTTRDRARARCNLGMLISTVAAKPYRNGRSASFRLWQDVDETNLEFRHLNMGKTVT